MFSKIKKFLFENSSTKQTVIKNTFWIAGGTTVAKVVRAVIIILSARILGTEDYGIFSYALSLAGLFLVLSDIGLTSILTRELSKDNETKGKYLSTILAVKLGLLALSTFLIAVVGPLISRFDRAKPLLIIVAVSIAFESLRSFFFATKRAESKMESEAISNIATELFSTIIVLIVFFKNPTPMNLALAYMIGNSVSLLSSMIYLRGHFKDIFKNFDPKLIYFIVMSAVPFAIMNVSSVFLTNIDSLMIAFYGTSHDLGVYAAAQRPIGLLYILPNFIGTSLFPIISKLSGGNDSAKTKNFLSKAYAVTMAIALPITLCGIVLAEPLIRATFGDQFVGALLTFQILLLTIILVFPGTLFSDFLLAENKQKIFTASSLGGAIINVGLNFILIPRYGIVGSAIGTIVAQIVINGILYFGVYKTHKLSIFKGLGKIFLATISIAFLSYGLKSISTPLIFIILISIIIYATLLLIMKDKTALEIREVLRAK